MTYYDRIQNAINYIEDHLQGGLQVDCIAKEAYMSIPTFYRLFFALTGYSVKDYARRRRLCEALRCVGLDQKSILDIAMDYGFGSHASFTKLCKNLTGKPPSRYKDGHSEYMFERIDLMKKYVLENEVDEAYPEIKVLKTLEPFRVAYYCYQGESPEAGAFDVMAKWFVESGLDIEAQKIRIFGFNNPSPTEPDQKEYGYEVWVTIDEDYHFDHDLVKTKVVEGGLYAVCGVKNLVPGGEGQEIMEAWQKLNAWLKGSKFKFGHHQWLEEHFGFTENFEHVGGMDLYMPVAYK